MSERSQPLNALVGAAVTIGLVFIPFSSVLGGGVAGYLQGGSLRSGLRVGALSGLFAAVPMLILIAIVGAIFSFGRVGMEPPRMLAVGGIVVLFSVLYLVGLSAFGGAIGAAVRGDSDLDPRAEE